MLALLLTVSRTETTVDGRRLALDEVVHILPAAEVASGNGNGTGSGGFFPFQGAGTAPAPRAGAVAELRLGWSRQPRVVRARMVASRHRTTHGGRSDRFYARANASGRA